MSRFTHLHTHSHYSLLNALPQIPDLVAAAKKAGMEALALTDNGNMYGALEFYKECKKQGIKPILGIDAYVAARTRFDKQGGIDNQRTRLILLCKDVSGYHSMLKLVTDSFLEGFYYKPRIDQELIEKYKEGLVCISPSFAGDIAQAVKMHDLEKAERLAAWYQGVFGKENFFIEITHHPEIQDHSERMEALAAFAKSRNIPIMAAHDVYYLKKEDHKAREVLMSIQNGGGRSENISDFEREEDFSFIDGKTAEKYFKSLPKALENTEKIADMCNLEIELGHWMFPEIPIASGLTPDDELRRIVFEGIPLRDLTESPEVLTRVEYELKVIKDKGYAKYFLVVSDLLKFAHEHGILTTIRGSVAGSLVTYLSFITNINPLVYKLPFERFLNPERPSAPDIDMDYADNRRDEMIAYAKEKYGVDRVAQIGTFGTMAARGAVRDVARAMGYAYGIGDTIAKLIPMGSQGMPMTIERALKIEPDLKKLYQQDADTKTIIDMAMKIEGCARHISVHAAGVVISPSPLTDYVPLQLDPKGEGKVITQYDMHSVDENAAGLLKFDFLGIRNLSILADAVSLVKKIDGIDIDIENVAVDDANTFAMLARGETIGLFQLNGTGMTQFLIQLKPTTIFDINAMVALYRPGPMEMIPDYIARKHDPKKIKFLDPRMRDILDQSFGIITYQDDVMLIAIKLAGYSWLEADKLRKAMGKKIPAEMEAQKTKLNEGFIKNGLTEAKADELWKLIEPFAAYGFNKAHAASYGKVAYQTAYMKANFPAIYMSAVLTAESGNIETVAEVIAECKRMKIPVLPPDINESFEGFTVVKNPQGDEIRFGLTTIKNFGEGIGHAIINERKASKFKSLADFLDRVKDKNLNKKSLESLIKCGAMDAFGERGVLLANLESIIAYNKEGSNVLEGQVSLFGLMSDNSTVPTLKLEPAPEASQMDKLTWEKELLGLYISGHPLDRFQHKFTSRDVDIKKVKESYKEGQEVVVGGIIEECKDIFTKKGDKMLFIKLTDLSDSLELVVFPKVFVEFQALLKQENCVAIKGKVSHRNGSVSMIADKVKLLE